MSLNVFAARKSAIQVINVIVQNQFVNIVLKNMNQRAVIKKEDHSIHCCANCLTSNIDDHKTNARNHNASSFKCPFYVNSVLSIKQNTIDWLPKNC